MIKICFVCIGNTCRSIMAERLMKKVLKDRKIEGIKVASRGLSATGENISENAKIVLKEYRATYANRKSIKLGKIDKNTLYITMTANQKQAIKSKNVISFKELIGFDILDPYGQDIEVYRKSAKEILSGINILIEKMELWR